MNNGEKTQARPAFFILDELHERPKKPCLKIPGFSHKKGARRLIYLEKPSGFRYNKSETE